MKERPILFNGPMVRALLDGSKTQTRRIVKGAEQWPANAVKAVMLETRGTAMAVDAQRCSYGPEIKCPYGQPGDRLWVRETWMYGQGSTPIYRADKPKAPEGQVWRPSIHMPRVASRITLEVVSVRVERLQDISEADADAEGCRVWPECKEPAATNAYRALWESINGPSSWDANRWVWVIEFKRITP